MSVTKQWYRWCLDRGVPLVPSAGLKPDGQCTCGDVHCSRKGAHVGNGLDFPEVGAELKEHENIALDVNDSGLLCLEIGNIKAWNKLKERYDIPKTWSCFSEGKWLVFFDAVEDINVMWSEEDVSVRVSYVLAPPSKMPDGTRVKWLIPPDKPLAKVPAKLRVLMEAPKKKSNSREEDEILEVKQSVLRTYIRRMFFSQERKLSGQDRRDYAWDKVEAYNANTTPPLHKPLLLRIFDSEIRRIEALPAIPDQAIEAVSLFDGQIVDHLAYREA